MRKLPTRSSLAVCVGLVALVLAACSSQQAGYDVWTGTSTVDGGATHALRLEVRTMHGSLDGRYYVDAARGDFAGTVDGGSLVASLAPSAACTYTLTGTITSGTIDATYTPDACPGGQSGTWSLARP